MKHYVVIAENTFYIDFRLDEPLLLFVINNQTPEFQDNWLIEQFTVGLASRYIFKCEIIIACFVVSFVFVFFL